MIVAWMTLSDFCNRRGGGIELISMSLSVSGLHWTESDCSARLHSLVSID
ncbi:expressed unknown protein [Ectocarpus siliculosus]|uniref:Uncharacterized protein n=1 Tax=Ectocarpus siliculosus TaxID=2880 RepID=D8LRL5_ECTSI|nr:expressed unknown protein [Ectocarpus siliculosus]|eukprot:CBN77776.1 expressed unknown protein [Ectocarpus siliculosus]